MLFILSLPSQVLSELSSGFVRYFPGLVGQQLRYAYYKRKLKRLGSHVTIDEGVHFLNPAYISIGDDTWIDKNVILLAGPPHLGQRKFQMKENHTYHGAIGELAIGIGCHIAPNSVIQAHGGVEIGDYVGIASGGKLYSMSHHYRNLNDEDTIEYKFSPRAAEKEQFLIVGPVVMENNTALGLNSVVLPCVTIGKNSWVGVNSYVASDIPPNSIASGSPAKVLKKRFERVKER